LKCHTFGLLERIGIELEYMVVDEQTLRVAPLVDRLFDRLNGAPSDSVRGDQIDWSNEIVAHVLEFKNAEPHPPKPQDLCAPFAEQVARANKSLAEFGCKLMPTSMHPFMDPLKETHLWPLGNKDIYQSYDRIFTCSGHGWSNLQSMHINLSFASADDFHRLHSAIRLVLPLIPALAASSPIVEGKITGSACNRMLYYLENQRRIPSIAGLCIPEPIRTPEQYESEILRPMYHDIDPFDPDKLLQAEWLNSRGAIPKFEMGCIEIRISDLQEHPGADLALAEFWLTLIRHLCGRSSADVASGDRISTSSLRTLMDATIQSAEKAHLAHPDYLAVWAWPHPITGTSARDLMLFLRDRMRPHLSASSLAAIDHILTQGTLARRILQGVGPKPSEDRLRAVYQELTLCLAEGRLYDPKVSIHL
jgi:carboxylate-amine ligase